MAGDLPIPGFSIYNFRSFHSGVQRIAPCSKVNLFIGQNNSGKSSILHFLIHRLSPTLKAIKKQKAIPPPTDLDVPQINLERPGAISVFLPLREEIPLPTEDARPFLNTLLDGLRTDSGVVEVSVDPNTGRLDPGWIKNLPSSVGVTERNWFALWNSMTNNTGGGLLTHWIPEVMRRLTDHSLNYVPTIALIDAHRRIGEPGSPFSFSGQGIIERLAQLQNPTAAERHLRHDFENINALVRDVLENPEATIEVPHDRKNILVHMDGKALPLENLGTGIHEVVIIGVAVTLINGAAVCIEEPEIHLHPALQRKLLRYLHENTSNQYFITTHSAHLIDAGIASIFHVTLDQAIQRSVVIPAIVSNELSAICTDLGYKPSDLLQTNCIIWVEGPSDRIYVNHWIRSQKSDLVEGIHYSIVFYGGRLLANLTAESEGDADLVSLLQINRRTAVLMDSDKGSAHARVNKTKRRIKQEVEDVGGLVWITKGREIENYIEPALLLEAVKEVHPTAISLGNAADGSPYRNPLADVKTAKRRKLQSVDKVQVSRRVVARCPELGRMDLKAEVKRVVAFIAESNGMT